MTSKHYSDAASRIEKRKKEFMPAALIYDIDGTLLDSVDLHARAWQESFLHFGYQFPFDAIRSQIGKGGDQLLPVFWSREEIERHGKDLEEYRSRLFKQQYLSQVVPFPCVRELIKMSRSRGQKVAVASSAKGDELKIYERCAHIDDLLSAETSSADADKSKPHPDIFQAALSRLGEGIRPEDVVVIGDSPYDAEAARRAGLTAVGVRCGGFSEADLLSAGCIAIYDGPAHLLRCYDSSPLA